MRIFLFTLMLTAGAAAFSSTVYTWKDADGVTHYSDQPMPGSKKIEIQGKASTSSSTANQSTPSTAPPRDIVLPRQAAPVKYTSCAVVAPQNGETLHNVQSAQGEVRLDPALSPAHSIAISLDGQKISSSVGGFTMSPLYRGAHTLSVAVTAEDGSTVCQSTSTFHVRQASVNQPSNPNNPNRPRPLPARP